MTCTLFFNEKVRGDTPDWNLADYTLKGIERNGLGEGCGEVPPDRTCLLDDGDDDLDESQNSCDDHQSILELLTRRRFLVDRYELQVPPFVAC